MDSGETPDLSALVQQAAAMQEQLLAAQQDLEAARFDGTSGGGLVTATVTGSGELVGLVIDQAACDPDDTETLADLVLAAVRDAAGTARNHAAAQLGRLAGGFRGEPGGPGEGGQLGS